jgi:hypothetical protein
MCALDSTTKQAKAIRAAPPPLQKILDDLSRREPIFHRPEFGTSRADLERMTTEDFWETGASGRRYSRNTVLDELERRFSAPDDDVWDTSDFRCQRLAEDLYLLTYSLVQNHSRRTRRSTIWKETSDGWKIVYHHGSVVQEG